MTRSRIDTHYSPYSRLTRGSGASAEPRQHHNATPNTPSSTASPEAVERYGAALLDAATVVGGLLVFGAIAYVCLVLA